MTDTEVKEEQKPVTALERIEQLERDILALVKREDDNHMLVEHVLKELSGFQMIKSSVTGLAKLTNAIVATLSEKKIIEDSDVINNIKKFEEKAEQDEVRALVADGAIVAVEAVTPMSLVISSISSIDKESGEVKGLSPFKIIPIFELPDGDPSKSLIINKKVGESVTVDSSDQKVTYVYNVKEIYDLVQKGEVSPEN
jgi:hypothetical protein